MSNPSFNARLFFALPGAVCFVLGLMFGPARSFGQIPFVCQDQFYLTLVQPPTTFNEVIINNQNVVTFQRINGNLGIEVNAAGFRSTDNFIYCIAPQTRELVRIDATGTAEVLASLNLNPDLAYFAGDITPDGRFLVVVGTKTHISGLSFAAELARIDLASPNFNVTSVQITGGTFLIFDIAFNPLTGVLYGYDSKGMRVIRIDQTSGAVTTPFPSLQAPGITGSVFFDAFGRLFAYGSAGANSDDQNRLFELDTETGESRLLTFGALAAASDGCSCPYTVQLNKTVSQKQAYPCTEVEYTFSIANGSGQTRQGLDLDDVLPPGFTFVRVQSNPLGGTVLSQPGDPRFTLNNMTVPIGTSDVKIIVKIGTVLPGTYKNQAVLRNLPPSLGSERLSDDPTTLLKGDSTAIKIVELPKNDFHEDTTLCEGYEFVRLDAGKFGAQLLGQVAYIWQDGSTKPTFDARVRGEYVAAMLVGCDTVFANFKVRTSGIEVQLAQDYFTIQLGDSLFLEATAINAEANFVRYDWLDPIPGSIRCLDCPETWAMPYDDLTYRIRVTNEWGCRDSAEARVLVEKNRDIYFPNAIKPDGSLEPNNGVFYPSGDSGTNVDRLAVFSRWGELLFEANDVPLNNPNVGWDGSYRGRPMSPGVYVWSAKVTYLDGVEAYFEGEVTVVR